MQQIYLVADIGGTNARFALYDNQQLQHIQSVPCAEFNTIEQAIRNYLEHTKAIVDIAAIAIANPVIGDQIKMTNHHWNFSISALKTALNLKKLLVINDFTAQALAILCLKKNEKRIVCAGHAIPETPIAVIGPGTGLGVSGLIPCGKHWTALAGEGGHVSLAPQNDEELAVWQYARQKYQHISAERLISGAGLSLIDLALSKKQNIYRSAADITVAAISGESQAIKTLHLFSSFLATVAANLVLTLGARGGVYLCGGILPRITDYFINESPFKQRFTDKGRFSDYLSTIPVYLVTADNPGLIGAAESLKYYD